MPRDYSLYLGDMLESCQRIARFTANMTLATFQ